MKDKVLHVSCGGLGYGGVSAVIFSIVETLHDQFDFDCVVFKKRCERESLFQKYGNLHRIEAYNDDGRRHLLELVFRPWRMYRGIYKICKANKYQVIHCHNNNDEGICLLAAKKAGVPIRIAHSHNTPSPKKRNFITKFNEYANRKLINYAASERVGCSKSACTSFFGEVDFKVIFNSIDVSNFNASNRIQHNVLTFIHVGRYTYQKNQIMAIRVFEKINKVIPNSQLLLVGFGEDKEMLEQEIKNHHLEQMIQLIPGNEVDVSKMYAISDYMIFPSRYEGFGIVLIEAQAMGIRCFVSDAIQKEADIGLLEYIPLEAGVETWSSTILNSIKSGSVVTDKQIEERLYQYSNEAIGNQYSAIYKG